MVTMKSLGILLILCVGAYAKPASDQFGNCTMCTDVVSFATRVRNELGYDRLLDALSEVCNAESQYPGSASISICRSAFRDVLDMFANANPETFCEDVDACDASSDIGAASTTSLGNGNGNDVNCDFCQDVVTNVKEILTGKETQLELKSLVQQMCRYLGSFRDECSTLADNYVDQLFDYIRTLLQPEQFCQSIGACPKQGQQVSQSNRLPELSEVVNILPQQPADEVPVERPAQEITSSDNVECLLCKRIVAYIIQELKDNRTEQSIISALDHVCQLFPSKEKDGCLNFVNQYTQQIIDIVTEETDPSMACTLMGVCAPEFVRKYLQYEVPVAKTTWHEIQEGEEVSDVGGSGSVETANSINSAGSTVCYECETITHFIQDQLYDVNNEAVIENYVKRELCQQLRNIIARQTCDAFVKEYGNVVIQTIAQKLDPKTICQQELKLCPKLEESSEPTADIVVNNSPSCDLCVNLVRRFDYLLQDETFDREMTSVVEKACVYVSSERRSRCVQMVEAFAPYFLQMIGHLNDPKEICKSIDICYTPGQVHLLGGQTKCSWGPTYWCHTAAHAEACKATSYCQGKVWEPTQ